jgi:MinD superfamily P-loop ATPase
VDDREEEAVREEAAFGAEEGVVGEEAEAEAGGADMKIAVASGKGGTGKTTVAVGLALSLAEAGGGAGEAPPPLLLDCDVEAPDAHLFLRPTVKRSVEAVLSVPRILPERCILCGDCVEACQFNALAVLGEEVHIFAELCHACGSCGLVCPTKAIVETPRRVGVLEEGRTDTLRFGRGVLDVGEAMPVPVIRQLKEWLQPARGQVLVLDTPPGTSCPMVETVADADFVLLVTEPTPCGLHDLELAVEVARELNLPAGVVVNRDGIGDAGVDDFCRREELPVLLRIPFRRDIAEGIARGRGLLEIAPEYGEIFREMATRIRHLIPVARSEERRPA